MRKYRAVVLILRHQNQKMHIKRSKAYHSYNGIMNTKRKSLRRSGPLASRRIVYVMFGFKCPLISCSYCSISVCTKIWLIKAVTARAFLNESILVCVLFHVPLLGSITHTSARILVTSRIHFCHGPLSRYVGLWVRMHREYRESCLRHRE